MNRTNLSIQDQSFERKPNITQAKLASGSILNRQSQGAAKSLFSIKIKLTEELSITEEVYN
jgi:hypothetical protein